MASSGIFRRSETAANRAETVSLLNNEEDNESTSVFVSPRKVKTEHELRPAATAGQGGGHPGRGAAGSSLGEALSLIEMEVQPGATLASIALKYNIPVAELKRVNNLLAENELFALKRIKIPVRPNSVLTEILIPGLGEDDVGEGAQMKVAKAISPVEKNTNGWLLEHFSTPPEASEVGSPVLSDTSDMSLGNALRDPGADVVAVPTHGHNNSASKQARKARRFLRAMDKDLAVIRQKSERLLNASGVPADISDLDLDQVVAGESRGVGMRVLSRTSVIVFLAVLAAVVIAILWFARHEFNIIKVEKPANLTEQR